MTNKQTKQTQIIKMPKHLKEWLVEQFKNVEDEKLTEHQFREFMGFVEQHTDNPFMQECFNTHLRNKQIED